MKISLSPFAPKNLVSRDGIGRPVPRQPAHPHTQVKYGTRSRGFSPFLRRCLFIYLKPPYAIDPVPNLSDHAISYRWRLMESLWEGWVLHGRVGAVLGVDAAGLTRIHITNDYRTVILLQHLGTPHIGYTAKTRHRIGPQLN